MSELAKLLRKKADELINLPSEAQRFLTNPQAFTELFGVNQLPRETGFAAGATGVGPKNPVEGGVLNPAAAPYMRGYEEGEPIGIASSLLPLGAVKLKGTKGVPHEPVTGFLDTGDYRRVGKFQPNIDYSKLDASNLGSLQGVIEGRGTGARGAGPSEIAAADAEVQRLIANPDLNPAVQLSREFNPNWSMDLIKNMPPSSLEKQFPIAKAYEALATNPDPRFQGRIFAEALRNYPEAVRKSGATNYQELVPAAYEQLGKENAQQFERMLDKGMKFSYGHEGVTYKDSPEMLRDALLNKHLSVFRGGDRHEFLNKIDPYTGLNENEIFRANHDYLGHGTTGSSFGPIGEELAFGAHAQTYSPLARMAAASETRGQNSFVNYGGINADITAEQIKQRALRKQAIAEGKDPTPYTERLKELGQQIQYAPQKGLILPPEMLDINYKGGVPEYMKEFITPTNPESFTGYHWSNIPDLTQTNPAMHGTGTKGEEAARLAQGLRDRTYFYTNPNLRESGLGGNQYEANLENMYNLSEDKDKLAKLANIYNPESSAAKRNAFERLVNEAGYEGYVNPDYQAGLSFYPQDIFRIK